MKMLRSWNGDSLSLVQDMLARFGIEAHEVHLLKFEVLSPDSFIWLLSAGEQRYCLYAEDYVASIDDVVQAMKKHGILEDEADNFELLQVKDPEEFAASSPVVSADTYEPPTDAKEFMKYAAPSGYDFAFLGKSKIS